jgi:hypothetical protein
VLKSRRQVPGLLSDPGPDRMGRDARQEDLATLEVDEEQHVETTQCDGIHGEEITRQRPSSLSPEELGPRRSRSSRCGAKTVTTQDIAHACRRYGDTELGALPDDAEIAPARVLPRQAEDESDDVGIKSIASILATVRVGPVPRQELPMPAHERRWCHEESDPTLTPEQSCQRGEHSTVGGGVPGARDLATKYGELMTKHRDLDVFVVGGGTDSKQVEQPSNHEERNRIVHVNDRGRFKKSLVSARIACLHPSGHGR